MPPIADGMKYTLVLDLDETLIHMKELNENDGELSIWPGAESFIYNLAKYMEIIIFTAGT